MNTIMVPTIVTCTILPYHERSFMYNNTTFHESMGMSIQSQWSVCCLKGAVFLRHNPMYMFASSFICNTQATQ